MVSIQPVQNKQSVADLTTDQKQTSGDIPPSLIGASTTVINDCVYIFGGRVASTRQMINHLYVLHIPTLVWTRHIAAPDSALPPVPRYFHSASVYKERYIVLFGGMGSYSPTKRAPRQQQQQVEEQLCALDDLHMFDTETMAWVEINVSPSIFKPLARYAHLSTLWDNDKLVIIGGQDITNHHINEMSVFDLQQKAWIHGSSINGLYDAYRAVAFCPLAYDGSGKSNAPFWQEDPVEESSSIEELPPPPACIYSNYNFNDIARDLQSFCPLKSYPSTVDFNNHTSNIAGTILPPGLRFPTGQLMGHYFIISGTFLSTTQRGFQVWVLNLSNLTWSHIDTGSALGNGSWNRGLVVNKKFYILGNGYRDLKEDYSYRRLNFEHVAVIDLEAFGIYTMPTESCSPAAQELGLTILNEHGLSDVIIVTTDQQSISANSNILSERWPEFSQLMAQTKKDQLQKRHLLFPEAYPVTLAFLQFIYTDHLITAQQHQPQILSRLLILADMYKMDRLKQLATYGLHQLLTISTASMVYETATLTFQSALQIRALRIMMNAKRMLLQQQPPSDWMPLSPSNSTYSDEPIVRKQLSSSTSENSQRFKSPPSTPKKMYIPNDKIGGQPFPFTFH